MGLWYVGLDRNDWMTQKTFLLRQQLYHKIFSWNLRNIHRYFPVKLSLQCTRAFGDSFCPQTCTRFLNPRWHAKQKQSFACRVYPNHWRSHASSLKSKLCKVKRAQTSFPKRNENTQSGQHIYEPANPLTCKATRCGWSQSPRSF